MFLKGVGIVKSPLNRVIRDSSQEGELSGFARDDLQMWTSLNVIIPGRSRPNASPSKSFRALGCPFTLHALVSRFSLKSRPVEESKMQSLQPHPSHLMTLVLIGAHAQSVIDVEVLPRVLIFILEAIYEVFIEFIDYNRRGVCPDPSLFANRRKF